MHQHIRATFCIVAVLTATGCGGTSATPPPSPVVTPSTLGPQVWKVSAGASSHNEAAQALLFYPSAITIDAGDSIVWTAPTAEVHSISFPIAGQTPVPPTDPTASIPVGGTSYDGSAYVSSGFIAGGATYKLTFPKAGTYKYFSLPQEPIAGGTVVVQPAGTPYPTAHATYDSTAGSAAGIDLQNALDSVASVPFAAGSNTIAAGVSPATSGGASSAIMRFLSGPTLVDNLNVTVAAGTTLKFMNLSNNVPHTVTFPALGQAPPGGPPFQPASGGTSYDGTALVNSGVIPPGGSYELTFTKAGTYKYYCLFHDDDEGMVGTVTVTP